MRLVSSNTDTQPWTLQPGKIMMIKYIVDVWEVLTYNHFFRPFGLAPNFRGEATLAISSRQSFTPATRQAMWTPVHVMLRRSMLHAISWPLIVLIVLYKM